MKRLTKAVLACLVVSLLVGSVQTGAWAQSEVNPQNTDPVNDLYNMGDLLFVRPMAALAGVAGGAIFILSLPFTIPTKSVDKAAKMLIDQPFKFAFEREFPDEEALSNR